MALIMTLMRGAVRSGLYAMRSMAKPMTLVSSSTSGMHTRSGTPLALM